MKYVHLKLCNNCLEVGGRCKPVTVHFNFSKNAWAYEHIENESGRSKG